jgi:hypothetical protein
MDDFRDRLSSDIEIPLEPLGSPSIQGRSEFETKLNEGECPSVSPTPERGERAVSIRWSGGEIRGC